MARPTVWTAIADMVGSEIAAGQYRPGDKLPTEADLAARFDVNRHTVRRALAALVAAGTLRTRRGAGTFVAEASRSLYPINHRVRFTRNVLADRRIPSRRFTRKETRRADAAESAALGLATGSMVHVVEGVSSADGQPLAVFRSVFPADRLPGLPAALAESGSITAALSRIGIADYTRASTRLTAELATPTLALHLQIKVGAPVLLSVAVNVDPAGRPVEYGTAWFCGERVTLSVDAD